jgi:branched-chain amino acid transport system substrate-binding protein
VLSNQFRFTGLIISLLLCLPSLVSADDTVLYDRAHRLMANGRYSEAYQIFTELSNYGTDIRMASDYQFFRAKAAYYADDADQALEDFNLLVTRFPRSTIIPYGYFFIGNIEYKRGNITRAVKAYLNSYRYIEIRGADAADFSKLQRVLIESLDAIARSNSSVILENLTPAALPMEKRCHLLTQLSGSLSSGGSHQAVRSLLAACEGMEIEDIIARTEEYSRQQVDIGILLPLSGELHRFGQALLDGIRLKIEQYALSTGRHLRPIIYDTKGDQLESGRAIRRLSAEGAAAAIGPLTSDEAAVASAVLACGDVPLIIPAASQAGLTELSPTSFQLRPNLEWQGIMMADFAVRQIGADTAAIITPTSPENLTMARAFARRFEAQGGTIAAIEYFRSGETDFGPYVKDIKAQIIGQLLDSIPFLDADGDTIEAEEVPVRLDCIYIPAEADQLRMLLPQIDFYNLNSVYLGGDGWGTDAVYRLGDRITKTNYFTSGRIESGVSEKAQLFFHDFDLKHGHRPGYLESFGYDAMSLICEALSNGYFSRSEISQYLSSITGYQGVSGIVSFGENRENVALPIYTIENGTFKEVDIIDDY